MTWFGSVFAVAIPTLGVIGSRRILAIFRRLIIRATPGPGIFRFAGLTGGQITAWINIGFGQATFGLGFGTG
jgi:hypothetical protein